MSTLRKLIAFFGYSLKLYKNSAIIVAEIKLWKAPWGAQKTKKQWRILLTTTIIKR